MNEKISVKAVSRGRGSLRLLFVFAVFLFLAGCAELKGLTPVASPYHDTLNQWTRGKKVYVEFETRLYLYATYKSMAFRRAYVQEYAARYQLDDEYKRVLMDREREAFDKYNEFFLAAYTPLKEWNDFDSDDSVWRLYLDDDAGRRLVPVQVEKVDTKDPLIREFFPYLDYWSSGYIVRFPKYADNGSGPIPGGDTRFLSLVATGIKGTGSLKWDLVQTVSQGE